MDSLLTILAITAQIAGLATLLVAVPAVVIGYALARARFVGKSIVEAFVALPLVLPPTAVGYLLLSAFGRDGFLGPRALGFDPGILLTWRGAVVATAVVAFPLACRTARAAFEAVDPRLEKMAGSLGFGRLRTFLTISLPLARRGLAAALALAFGRALGEFGATVIVAGNIPGRTQTLALAIFAEIQMSRDDRALALVGVAAVVSLVAVHLIERWSRPLAPSPGRSA